MTTETQDELKLGIGNEEAVTLKPAMVKIVSVSVDDFTSKKDEKKKGKKVNCMVKHPDKEELIKISSIKYESKGKLDTSGLWVNKDTKGLIRKGSALAVFLQSTGSQSIENLTGKEIQTTTDEKGYLVFKCY
jgi:hypothetical protein